MHKFLAVGLIKKVTIYSGDEHEFDVLNNKKAIVTELSKLLDLSLYEEKIQVGEIVLSLKRKYLDENIHIFLKEIEKSLGSFVLSDKMLVDDYIENDVLAKAFEEIDQHIGIEFDYLKVWARPLANCLDQNVFVDCLNRLSKRSFDNILKRAMAFYICE